MTNPTYIVKMGRSDQEVTKVLFPQSRKSAINLANALSFVLWGVHAFKRSDCQTNVRHEQEGFWIEFIIERRERVDETQMRLSFN